MDESTLHEQIDEFLPRLEQLLGRGIPDAEELAEMTLESKLRAVDAAIRQTIRTKRQPIEGNVASDVVSDWLRICEMVLGLNDIRSNTFPGQSRTSSSRASRSDRTPHDSAEDSIRHELPHLVKRVNDSRFVSAVLQPDTLVRICWSFAHG
jgi:hypothetical protein